MKLENRNNVESENRLLFLYDAKKNEDVAVRMEILSIIAFFSFIVIVT